MTKPKPMTMKPAWFANIIQLEYSLKYKEVTKFTTPLGYFHDMKLLIAAENVREAIKALKLWHDDGKPEAIKATDLGRCVTTKI